MGFLKTITGRVVSGLVGLLVIVCAISWWRMDPAAKSAITTNTGRIFAWLGIVLVMPWLSFAVIGWVAKFDKNSAGAILVASLTGLELIVIGWIFHWSIGGATAWTFLALGGLVAALYNLLACDWIAEKVG